MQKQLQGPPIYFDSFFTRRGGLLIVALAIFWGFFRLGDLPVQEWDEARNGVNAIEMLQNGDELNLYYGGVIDQWNAQPPAGIWMMALSHKVFGNNTFALRFPAALCMVLLFFLLFKMITLYQAGDFAFFTCIILMSTTGIVGEHVGRTGDFDAPMLAVMIGAIYFFLLYHDYHVRKAIYYSAVLFGIAFWINGVASIAFFPAIFLYSLYRKSLWALIKRPEFQKSVFLFLLFPSVWLGLLMMYEQGYGVEQSSVSMLYGLFSQHILEPFVAPSVEDNPVSSYLFVHHYLDTKFHLWHFLFYASVGIGLYYYFTNTEKRREFISLHENGLLVFSVCVWLSLGLLFSFLPTREVWHLAPALPFIGITTAYGIYYFNWQLSYFKYFFLGLLIYTSIEHGKSLVRMKHAPPKIIVENTRLIEKVPMVICYGNLPPQDLFLYLKWHNEVVWHWSDLDKLGKEATRELIVADMQAATEIISEYPDFQIIDNERGFYLLLRQGI